MAFNINAQIILSQPKNLNNVSKQISKQLGKSTKIDLKIGNVRQLTTLNKQLTTLNNSLTKLNSGLSSTRGSVSALGNSFNNTSRGVANAAKAQGTLATQVARANQSLKAQGGLVGTLGKRFGSVAKQAIAFGAISRPIYDLQRALTGAVKDAVAFEREIVKISQVTGRTVAQLDGLTSQITTLSKELGISANELAETSRVIAQAGIRGKDLQQVLNALARSTLAPTFGKITDTTEGLIAAFGQFGLKGKDAEKVLGSLNQVSKDFAVEAEDLISVIRRTGGVFAQAAGNTKGTITALQELTAVFTAVRSSTRESADTIAAGLRTIFSRIQRRSTINFLKQFGVDLVDTQGKFVGIFPAFDKLSQRLDTLIKQGDALTLSTIAEELGGIRQIGKLLPAIAQFDKARKALTAAQQGAVAGLGGDVAKALDTIDNRVKRIRESFNALIRQVFESDAFQGFAKSFLNGSQAIIDAASSIFKTIEPILPLLTALGTIKIGRAIGGIIGGGGLGGGIAGAASTVSGSATAQNTQKTAAAVANQNSLINTTNSTLANMSRQLANLIQINNSGFNTLVSQTRGTGRSTVVTGFGGGRRRASGGVIPKFADGGRVYGPSHAAGGVIAELEGGEYVIPKKYAQGTPRGGASKGRRGNRAYVFDFDDTLGVSGSSGKELFSNDPELAASRQAKLRNAKATSLAESARKRSQQGFDVHVLTARFGTPGDQAALQDFLVKGGIKPGRTIFTGGLFKGEREPGKKPGTTRQLSTASKKARILAELSKEYDSILFLDDAIENVLKAKDVKGVRPIAVNKQTQALKRAATGGLIPGYAKGDIVANDPVGILFQDSNLSESDPADKSATISKKQLSRTAQSQLKGINTLTLSNIKVSKFSREANFEKQRDIVTNAISTAVAGLNKSIGQIRGANGRKASPIPKDKITKTADLTLGRVFEDYVTGLAGLSSPGTKNFDLIGSEVTAVNRSGLAAGPVPNPTDIKLNLGKSSLESVVKKAYNEGIFANEIAAQQGAKRKASGRGRRGAAAGGFIQKLATGDIVRANSVGVAILDPDDVADGKAKVSVKDIESQIGFTAGTKRGFSGVGAALKKNNFTGSYNIVKQGLNQKTSDRFNKVLAEGLIKGVDFAASELSGDLGLGPTTIDQASKTKFIQSQRSALRGDLFEAALSSLNNRGRFDSAVDFARPFDFPNGLQGPFADNFSKLPSKFVDAKSSVAAAPDSNIRGKIIREIAADVVKTDPNILAQKDRQTGGKASKKSPKQARGFGALTFASGGEVPVRISNGEMVVTDPKEVASRRGELQRINKLSTGGFASGTIARGPGTGTSDSIYTTLPEGAFVVNAASTKKYLGLRRGGLAGAGRATGAAQTAGGEAAGAGIGLLFAVQSLTASLGDASNELNNFINIVGTAVFALSAFGGIGGLGSTLKGLPQTLKNLQTGGGATKFAAGRGLVASRKKQFDLFGLPTGQASRFAKARAGFQVGGRAALGSAGIALAAPAIGKIVGDIAGPLIADAVTGKQEEVLGVKGSATTGQAQLRGSVEGGVRGGATGIGAGAGIGFLLGGPIGAGIGAAIGGLAGSIIGSEIGAANAVYQQEVFRAAKAFKGASDDVQKSLQAISQEATTTGFAQLAKDVENQNVKFASAVTKFNSKFNNEVTIAGESLSFLRDVTGQTAENGSTFFDGLDSFFGTSLSAANQAKQNSIKAFAEAGKLFNPEQLQGLKDSLNAGLEKFFAETDFSGIEGLDEASASAADKLQAAADAGNQLAQSLIRLQDETVRQTLIAQQQQLSGGNAQQRAAAQALTPLIIDPSILRNQERYNQFILDTSSSIEESVTGFQASTTDVLALNRQLQAARDASIGYTNDLKEQIDAQNAATEAAGKYNRAINSINKEFDFAIRILKEGLAGLSFASKQSSSRLSTLEANINAINAGTGQSQLQQFANPFQSTTDAAIAEGERFFNFIETNFGITSADALRNFNRLRTILPDVVEDTLRQAQEGTLTQEGEQVSGTILANSLRDALAAEGFQLPSGLEEFLVSGPGRQGDSDDSVQATARLEELLETGRIGEVLGKAFDAGTQSLEDFIDKINQSIKQIETEIKINVQQLKIQRELTKTLTDLNIAGQEREQQILEGSLRAGGRPDTIASAEANVRARARAIGGSSDVRELSARRARALQQQQDLRAQAEAGAIQVTEEYKNEQIRLTNEIARTTEALNFLATETETYAAILEEAGKVTADIGALEGGLEKTIQAIASGDVGAQTEIVSEQQSIFAALRGVASVPQALQALQALGKEENRALVDAIAGRQDAGADLRQLLLRQLGTIAERTGGPVGVAVSNQLNAIAAFEKRQLDLANQAKQVQERQATAAETIATQNKESIIPLLTQISTNNETFNNEFNQSVKDFGTAVAKFSTTNLIPPDLSDVEANTRQTANSTAALNFGISQANAEAAGIVVGNYNSVLAPGVSERKRQLDELIKQATDANLSPEQRAAAQEQVEIANFAELERIISDLEGGTFGASPIDGISPFDPLAGTVSRGTDPGRKASILKDDGTIDVDALKEALKDTPGLFDKLNKSIQNFNASVDQNRNQRRNPKPTDDPVGEVGAFFTLTPGPQGFAKGGSIFQPRGTDTVPAMLTPGEFVVKKSSVDQYGPGVMEAINSGNAQVYAASGGRVGRGVLYAQGGGIATGRGGKPSLSATTLGLTREERQRFIDEEIKIYKNAGTFESAGILAQFGLIPRQSGNIVSGSAISNVKLREIAADAQKINNQLDTLFESAGPNLNNLAEINSLARGNVPGTGASKLRLETQRGESITRKLQDNLAKNSPSLIAATTATPSLTGFELTPEESKRFGFRGTELKITKDNIDSLDPAIKDVLFDSEKELVNKFNQTVFLGTVDFERRRKLASEGTAPTSIEQAFSTGISFEEAAQNKESRDKAAAQIAKIEKLKQEGKRLEEQGKTLREKEASRRQSVGLRDFRSEFEKDLRAPVPDSGVPEDETAAQRARRLRNDELAARADARKKKRAALDKKAEERRAKQEEAKRRRNKDESVSSPTAATGRVSTPTTAGAPVASTSFGTAQTGNVFLDTVRGNKIYQRPDGTLVNEKDQPIGLPPAGDASTLERVRKSLQLRSRVDRFLEADDARQDAIRKQEFEAGQKRAKNAEEKAKFLIDRKNKANGRPLKYFTEEELAQREQKFQADAKAANAEKTQRIQARDQASQLISQGKFDEAHRVLSGAGYNVSRPDVFKDRLTRGSIESQLKYRQDIATGNIDQATPFQTPLSIRGVPGFDPNIPDNRADLNFREEFSTTIPAGTAGPTTLVGRTNRTPETFGETVVAAESEKIKKKAAGAATTGVEFLGSFRGATAQRPQSRVGGFGVRGAGVGRAITGTAIAGPETPTPGLTEQRAVDRAFDQDRRERNRVRSAEVQQRANAAVGTTTFGADGEVSLGTQTPLSRSEKAANRREAKAVNAFRIQFNRAILSGNYKAAQNIAQRYFNSGDISQSTIDSIKQQIDAQANTRAITAQLYNKGGQVSNVPIMAQTGEFVMNRQAVQRNGIGMLSRMNQGLPTFHSGGYVSGSTQYRRAGGRIFGRQNNTPSSAVTVNGADAAKELNNAIITGGETVKASWQQLFDTVAQNLDSALSQVSTIPNQINATVAPVQIEGVQSFTEALSAQLVPKIIEQIAPLINKNSQGNNSAIEGDGLNSRTG